jgi:hypothetical protein
VYKTKKYVYFLLAIINDQINILAFNYHNKTNVGVRVFVFNATFNNISVISWRTVLLKEEIRVSK